MTDSRNEETLPVLQSAWHAAHSVVDDRGNVPADLEVDEAKFVRRKHCRNLAKDDCLRYFYSAVSVLAAATRFRRSRCGTRSPGAAQRYDLLASLAKELESQFPQADRFLILAACRWVEMYWDR